MVNAPASCSEYAHFCKFFAVSGRILHFKNPFKYKRMFDINQENAGPGRNRQRRLTIFRAISMRYHLILTQDISAILFQSRVAPQPPQKMGGRGHPGELMWSYTEAAAGEAALPFAPKLQHQKPARKGGGPEGVSSPENCRLTVV
jgi:hypothetical protein